MSHRLLVPVLAAAAIIAPAHAGPLTPPAGPVAPTHKTLTHVEPRTPISAATTPGNAFNVHVIAQPGSYYLAGNVSVPAGKNGIQVLAADVTIDLNGFTIRGEAGSSKGVTTVEAHRLVLRNGRVSGFTGRGVDAQAAPDAHLGDLIVSECGHDGIVAGPGATVERCAVRDCGAEGFLLESGTTLRGCTAERNADNGFRIQGRTEVIGATARENGSAGVRCEGPANIVRQCTVTDNDVAGISVAGEGSLIAANYSSGNGGPNTPDAAGIIILSGTDNAVLDNLLWANSHGIHIYSAGNLIARNRLASSGSVASNGGNTIGPGVTGQEIWTNSSPDANYYY